MSHRNENLFINDIKEAISNIKNYIKGLSYEDFCKNKMVIDATVRNLEIIGEAAKRVSSETQAGYPNIPWKEMAGMRDKVIHEYFVWTWKSFGKPLKRPFLNLRKTLKKRLNKKRIQNLINARNGVCRGVFRTVDDKGDKTSDRLSIGGRVS